MSMIFVKRAGKLPVYFHSYGEEGEIRVTIAAEKAHHFSSRNEAHEARESREFWAGLEISGFETVAVGIKEEKVNATV